MKHGGFKAACLALSTCIAVLSVQADDKTVSLESRVLESFNGDSGYVWRADASKFTTKKDGDAYPKVAYVTAWPNALYGNNREGATLKSLGVWGRFDRQGYNWIDVFPVAKDAEADAPPVEIPIPGRAHMLDMWIWGSNFNYYMEAYVRDFKGVVHVIDLGDLNFEGWKNLRINIPENIPQSKNTLPKRQGLTLVKFRIWTRPAERVDDFQIYFDQVKILTDTFETLFDGNDLADPVRVQEIWTAGASNQGK
jgi:hypothetical protein